MVENAGPQVFHFPSLETRAESLRFIIISYLQTNDGLRIVLKDYIANCPSVRERRLS